MPLQAKDAEGKLEAQAKKTQDAGVKADAAREALKASTAAAAAVEAQLAALQARPYRPCSIALLYVLPKLTPTGGSYTKVPIHTSKVNV